MSAVRDKVKRTQMTQTKMFSLPAANANSAKIVYSVLLGVLHSLWGGITTLVVFPKKPFFGKEV